MLFRSDLQNLKDRCNEQSRQQGLHVPEKGKTFSGEEREELYDKLIENGCDADLIALEGADHADLQFFQDELWDRIIEFFKTKLG